MYTFPITGFLRLNEKALFTILIYNYYIASFWEKVNTFFP